MQGKLFATIELGSYNLSLEVFEISKKLGIRLIDTVTHRKIGRAHV